MRQNYQIKNCKLLINKNNNQTKIKYLEKAKKMQKIYKIKFKTTQNNYSSKKLFKIHKKNNFNRLKKKFLQKIFYYKKQMKKNAMIFNKNKKKLKILSLNL